MPVNGLSTNRGFCVCCNSKDTNDPLDIEFSKDGKNAIRITLCRDCRAELSIKLQAVANRSPCPRCGEFHDCREYEFLSKDMSHEDYPVWYKCPTCGGKFHSLEV